jgi:hypothetical protein
MPLYPHINNFCSALFGKGRNFSSHHAMKINMDIAGNSLHVFLTSGLGGDG